MDQRNLKELVRSARALANTPDFKEMVDHFEGFIELLGQREGATVSPELLQKLTVAHQQFWTVFQKVAGGVGMTPETLNEYFTNARNFTPAQWQEIQTIQREATEEKRDVSKKLKKHNEKMRI